jgi:DNA-binding transcriptional regulator GbsR (MarR family)
MAKPKMYSYKDSTWTTAELAAEFNVSYCRMNNLLRQFNGNIDDIGHYYGQARLSSKGKEAKTFDTKLHSDGSTSSTNYGPFMTIAEIAEVTGMSRAAINRRIKLGMTGVDLMKKKGEKMIKLIATKVAEKKEVRAATAVADEIIAKANKNNVAVREKWATKETGGKRVSEFIKELEKSAKEYREETVVSDVGTMIPELEDVADLERVLGKV